MKNTSAGEPTEGGRIRGYCIRRVEDLPEISSRLYEIEHAETGARHIHIRNKESENTFGVAFKTVPRDSTGAAHILEHTVLCGSRKYPVRDPFFSMLKRSLSSFMNAFTASDWTMYPFSTQNRKDFFNLLSVYLDAAFFPILDPLNFKQEGHRLEFEADAGKRKPAQLVYKGVVYNEMKGAMSSPRQVMTRAMMETLFPSSTYRFNSGGDPRTIPQLTYDQLKAFHQRHYHPSNAFFYTFGDIRLEEILAVIEDGVLKHFQRIDPQTEVPSQQRWRRPRKRVVSYPLGKDEDLMKKSQSALVWLTADLQDHFDVLCLSVLEQILLGNAASPLRRTLIESGLGAALSDGSGYVSDIRDTVFSCGLKDVREHDAAAIEEMTLGVLRDLVEGGVGRELIESALHQIEFHRKEVTNHPYPYGLKLLFSFSGNWIHGGDPVRILKFAKDMDTIRNRVKRGGLFENLIQKYLVENPHRVRLTMVPDLDMEEKENRRVIEVLASISEELEPDQAEDIRKDAEALQRLQESAEDLSRLPTLALDDIPPSVKTVREDTREGLPPAARYLQPTAGIFYFAAALGVGSLNPAQIPFVPFFCHAFSRVGTLLHDYAEMAGRIDRYTGGIGLSAHARIRFGSQGRCLPFITVSGKCLNRNEGEMFDILKELLIQFDFSDHRRLKHLLLEYRAGLEAMVVPSGHRLAMMLAARKFFVAAALDETWHGVHQLKFIKELTTSLAEDKLGSIAHHLSDLGKSIITDQNCRMAVIGEAAAVSEAYMPLAALRRDLVRGIGNGFGPPELALEGRPLREGWSTGTAVSFVADTFQTVRMEHDDAPALTVISKLLRSLYLHREVREKGGAYGGFALYNPENGLFSFASYRDPHIVSTLKVFESAAAFIRKGRFTDEDIKEAILQVCADIDKPDPPGPAARKAFYRKILDLDDDARSRFKQKILTLTRDQITRAVETYFTPDGTDHAVAVISSEEKLAAANKVLTHRPLVAHAI